MFKIKPNVLPKHIKMLQRYINESDDESSYESESSYETYDSSAEYTTSSGSSSNSSEYSDESGESYESLSVVNFKEFLDEFSKTRKYTIKNDPLVIRYNFDSKKVSGKWKRHVDKSITMNYKYLVTDKSLVKKGIFFTKVNRL